MSISARHIEMELAARRQAKDDMLLFTKYTMPEFDINWHHRVLARKLERFDKKLIKNLLILAPPQVGKSESSTRRFPAFAFGRNPDVRIAMCAYNQTFTSQFNRDVQRIITSERYKNVFPDTVLNEKNVASDAKGSWLRNSEIFEIVGRKGFFKSTGVGGPLTGTSADIGIIDDPIKDKAEAESKVYRERLWQWYVNVFKTRLHNDSQQLITLTRWHEDDLAGRILAQEPDKWEVLVLQAINTTGPTEDDPRQIGEVLWPEKHSLERMLDIKKNNPATFNSLYQQTPTEEGGNIIKRDSFKIIPFHELPAGIFNQRVDITVDPAYTKESKNDPTGLMAFTEFQNDLYIFHWETVRLEFSELCAHIIQYRDTYGDQRSMTWIEPKASGISIVQYLKRNTSANIAEWKMTDGDKISRLYGVEGYITGGRVILVRGGWNRPFVEQCAAFPNAPHDEAIDNLVMAINQGLVRNQFRARQSGRKAVVINRGN